MSFDGQVLCHRMLITPWALTTFGAATADAVAVAAATLRKLRRVGRAGLDGFDIAFLSLDFGWPCRPSLFDQPRAYRPVSSNSIAETFSDRKIAYLPRAVMGLRRNAPLGRTAGRVWNRHRGRKREPANSLRAGNLTGNLFEFRPFRHFLVIISKATSIRYEQLPGFHGTGNFLGRTGSFSPRTGNSWDRMGMSKGAVRDWAA